jgi:hypothetical protein
MLNKEDKDIVR